MKPLIEICGRAIKVSGGRVRTARLDLDLYTFLDDPAPTIEALRALPNRPDLFTFTQSIPDQKPRFNFPVEWDNLAVMPISTYEEWFEKQILSTVRNRARQASKKGVVFRSFELDEKMARGIWDIYNETPIRQGRHFPHFGNSLETVYEEEATYLERSQFIGAFVGEELIGFIKLVHDEARVQAGLMNILSKMCHRDKSPTNALIGEAVRWCASNGIPNLAYWHYAYGKLKSDALTEFKDRHGFRRVDLPRYYVPLTVWGSVALRLGLHHRFVDRLPENVGKKLRDLRGQWYNRKQTATKAPA